jgi:hypothetical protein
MIAPTSPPNEWCALRVWAANVRDNDSIVSAKRDQAAVLCSILDSQHSMRTWHPEMAPGLWDSCLQLASKIAAVN